MPAAERTAILLDGGFVKKQLENSLGHFPSPTDVSAICTRVMNHPDFAAMALFRAYYYDADPFTGKATNPLDGTLKNFATTPQYVRNDSFIKSLENEPNFAVRRGALVFRGWILGRNALKGLSRGAIKTISAVDIVPKLEQKGVDMRIGLDIASLALKRLVSTVVLVTGDSDMVPAMKLARREGLRVYLDTLGQTSIRQELKVHADVVM